MLKMTADSEGNQLLPISVQLTPLLYHAPFMSYMSFIHVCLNRKLRHADFSTRGHYMSNIITDSESQYPISYLCSITTFCLSLTVKKLLRFSFWLGFAYKGRNFGGFGGRRPPKFEIWFL